VISGRDDPDLRFSVFGADELIPLAAFDSRADGRSFRCRAWVSDVDDLTFTLAWPVASIRNAGHEVTGIREAASQAVCLWSV
jgi:hypothetical protein